MSTKYKSANFVIKTEDEEIEINQLREILDQPSYREIIFAGFESMCKERSIVCTLKA